LPGYIVPLRPTVLEGDYSTWTEKWNTSVTAIDINRNHAIIDVDGNRVFFVSYNRMYFLKLSNGELLETRSIGTYGYANDYVVESIKGKYLVSTEDAVNIDTLKIFKDGVLKQTITPLAGDVICGVGISSDGKYIVVGMRDADKVYCYEGS